MMDNSARSEKPEKGQGAACEICEDPFKFYGISASFRLLRCQTCETVCIVDWPEVIPDRRNSPQQTFYPPVDLHFPE
jgi:hypothetical protein